MNQIDFKRRAAAALIAGATLAAVGTAHAQAPWPTRPVTIVVAYPPGGMTDIVSRLLAKDLQTTFKQPFIVENRPGASGQVGTELVARKPADGYTLLVTATGFVISPLVRANVHYNPLKDLLPISALVQTPNMIVVNPGSPAKTVPEFLAWAKTQKSIPYGTAGTGGSTHLGGELLRTLTGLPFTHVPYRGAAAAVQDTIAGQVQVTVQDSVTVAPFLAAGQLRPIAVTSAHRSANYPDLPTLKESGFPNFDVYTWLAFLAPAGLPQDIAFKLNAATNKIMHTPEMIAALKAQTSEPMESRDLAQTRKFFEDEIIKWGDLVRKTGVKVED